MATKNAYSKCKSAVVLLFILFLLPAIAFAVLTDNGDGTISDSVSGLMWQKGFYGPLSWDDAVAAAAADTTAGQTDWRLPKIEELRTLIDSTYAPQLDPIFIRGNQPRDWTTWSSTEIEDDDYVLWDRAYYVFFEDGSVNSAAKGNNYSYRVVRANSPPSDGILWDVTSGDVIIWDSGGSVVAWE